MGTITPFHTTLRDRRTVLLRSAEPADASDLIAVGLVGRDDPHTVVEPGEPTRTLAERTAEIIAAAANPQHLMLVARDGPTLAGELELTAPRLRRIAHRGRFSILVAPGYRGVGVGEALIRAMLDWATAHPTIEKVRLGVLSTNIGAQRLYRRLGFEEEARRSREFCLSPGVYADDILMARYVKPL
jgi:ribosomal protein S18 acetylase RimI-like enzyme